MENPGHDYKDVGGTPAGMSVVELRRERTVENHVWNRDRESTRRVRCIGYTSIVGTWMYRNDHPRYVCNIS